MGFKILWLAVGLAVGASLSLLVRDYLQVKKANVELRAMVMESNEISGIANENSLTCRLTLESCKATKEAEISKAKLMVLTKYETIRVMEAAGKGDKMALAKLMDPDWVPLWHGESGSQLQRSSKLGMGGP